MTNYVKLKLFCKFAHQHGPIGMQQRRVCPICHFVSRTSKGLLGLWSLLLPSKADCNSLGDANEKAELDCYRLAAMRSRSRGGASSMDSVQGVTYPASVLSSTPSIEEAVAIP